MKLLKIKKGRHYCTPFPFPKFYLCKNKFSISLSVIFNNNCRYDIGQDQSDVNKLYGFSYGLHHKNSDRIGWRYSKEKDMIELVYYYYIDGERRPTRSLAFVPLDDVINVNLDIETGPFYRTIKTSIITSNDCEKQIFDINTNSIPKRWGYTLGLYFGGNQKAPHEMLVSVEKKKKRK